MRQLDEPVSVVEYEPDWPVRFALEHRLISEALGVAAADLEHIGSTAVPGLAAKPIIDLMLGVDRWLPSPKLLRGIGRLGYEALGEAGVSGRQYFRLRRPAQANLHVVLEGGVHWLDNLTLREYLRNNAAARERYARVKLGAIADGAASLLAYSAAKAAVVGELLQEALAARNAS